MMLGIGFYAPCMIMISLLGHGPEGVLSDHDGRLRVPDSGRQHAVRPQGNLRPEDGAVLHGRRQHRACCWRRRWSIRFRCFICGGWCWWSSSTRPCGCCTPRSRSAAGRGQPREWRGLTLDGAGRRRPLASSRVHASCCPRPPARSRPSPLLLRHRSVPAPPPASGRPTAATSPARNTRRSIRSHPPTSSRSEGRVARAVARRRADDDDRRRR